jgi:DNA-binding NtrC family response regulator
VDDEETFLSLTATALERESDRIRVESVDRVVDGLARVADWGVDGVVSDYQVPERNGIEFLSSVRQTHPDLPFVLFTGKGSETVGSAAVSTGVTDYLRIPTGPTSTFSWPTGSKTRSRVTDPDGN